jgi:aminoglycoside phosphotransferase (APT) family kinase protein
MSDGQLTTAVREPIPLDSLKQWIIPAVLLSSSATHSSPSSASLAVVVDDFEWSVSQFGWGQSNPTYKITLKKIDQSQQYHYVLRKKPRRIAHKSAHALHREYQVLSALRDHTFLITSEKAVPIPRVYAYCSDISILGTEFYIMEYVEGYIFTDPALPIPATTPPLKTTTTTTTTNLDDTYIAEMKTRAYQEIIRVLSNLHSVDWRAIGLTQFRRKTQSASSSSAPSSYLQRQLQILNHMTQTQASISHQSIPPAMIHIAQQLARYAPHAPRLEETLIHGDFKMDNLVFDKSSFGNNGERTTTDQKNTTTTRTFPKIRAVLDWELSTIGDPLMDLANLGLPYYFPKTSSTDGITGLWNDEPHGQRMHTVVRDTDTSRLPPGIPTFPTVIDWYCEFRNIQPLTLRNLILEWRHYYVAFACYKNSVIVQGVAQRLVSGTATSAKAQQVVQLLPILLDLAQQLLTSFASSQECNHSPPSRL